MRSKVRGSAPRGRQRDAGNYSSPHATRTKSQVSLANDFASAAELVSRVMADRLSPGTGGSRR